MYHVLATGIISRLVRGQTYLLRGSSITSVRGDRRTSRRSAKGDRSSTRGDGNTRSSRTSTEGHRKVRTSTNGPQTIKVTCADDVSRSAGGCSRNEAAPDTSSTDRVDAVDMNATALQTLSSSSCSETAIALETGSDDGHGCSYAISIIDPPTHRVSSSIHIHDSPHCTSARV